MSKTYFILTILCLFPCGGAPVKILDASLQPFTAGRQESNSGTLITIILQPQKPSAKLHINTLIFRGDSLPVTLRNPLTGTPVTDFRKKDKLMIRETFFLKRPLIEKKKETGLIKYSLKGKEHTLEIKNIKVLEAQIRRNP